MPFPTKRSTNTSDFGDSARFGGADINAAFDYIALTLSNIAYRVPNQITIEPVSGGGALSRDDTGTQIMTNADPGLVFTNAFTQGTRIGVKGGLYIFQTPAQIPNTDNLTIVGGIDGIGSVIDMSGRNGGTVWASAANRVTSRQGGVFNHSWEYTTYGSSTTINNLTISNFTIIAGQTPLMYRADDYYGAGLRLDNVVNCKVDNITSYNSGYPIGLQIVSGGSITNCRSYYDAAFIVFQRTVENMTVANCFAYATMDDSYALLGYVSPGTHGNTLINCIADKGMEYDVSATCFKCEDSATGYVNNNTFINCTAKNNRPGGPSPPLIGGFYIANPTCHHLTYTNCSAINNIVGFELTGDNVSMVGCLMANNDVGLYKFTTSPYHMASSSLPTSPSAAFYQNDLDIKTY